MIEKIAALLAKAEDPAATPAEAELYTAKAEELMLKYGIEAAQVASNRTVKADEIVTVKVRVSGGYSLAYLDIAFAIGSGLGSVRVFKSKSYDGHQAWFVGFERDVANATTLFESLRKQADQQMKAWWASARDDYFWESEHANWRTRRQFISSFGWGAGSRLGELRTRIVAETSSALVLSDRAKEVDAHIQVTMKIGKGSGNRAGGSYNAAVAGRRAGREAVNPRGVTA